MFWSRLILRPEPDDPKLDSPNVLLDNTVVLAQVTSGGPLQWMVLLTVHGEDFEQMGFTCVDTPFDTIDEAKRYAESVRRLEGWK